MSKTINIPLTAPITAHGAELMSLDLRRPTPHEVREIGLPYSLGRDGMPHPDVALCTRYVVKCASLPLSSVDQMELVDVNRLCWEVTGFFVNSTAETSTEPSSTSPGTGE